MEPDSTSTLDSIVIHGSASQWFTLSGSHPLSQLRDKFWHYSVKEEEKEWRRDHPEGETMEVDEDTGTEIGPGCYPLDLDIENLGFSDLWVRQDYIRIYDFCDRLYNTLHPKYRGTLPSVLITGQPGIGKSYWIRYALRRRLGEGKLVIWYRGWGECFLFAADGVHRAPPDHSVADFKSFIWTLADSDEVVASHLSRHTTKHFLIYTSSPNKERWAPLRKTTRMKILIMNPWTREEILQAALLHDLTDIDCMRINELYNQFGPTPHLCIDFLLDNDESKRRQVRYENAIRTLTRTAEQLRSLASDSSGMPNMDAVSHTIFLVKRASLDDLQSWSVEPITTSVKSALQRRIREEERGEQIRLYESLAAVEASRRTAGLVFESLGQAKLQERVELELFPMVKRTPDGSTSGEGSKRRKLPQWYSNHSSQSDHHWIDFTPTETVEYPGSALEDTSIQRGIFYVPELKNQVAFDSFILANSGYLYIFQFSIASNHPIKPGMVPFFSQPSLPPKTMWRFVFVIPTGSEISCPEEPRDPGLKELMKEMELFSAELDPSV